MLYYGTTVVYAARRSQKCRYVVHDCIWDAEAINFRFI